MLVNYTPGDWRLPKTRALKRLITRATSSLVCLNVINKYHKYIMEIYVETFLVCNDQDLADAFKEYGTIRHLLSARRADPRIRFCYDE